MGRPKGSKNKEKVKEPEVVVVPVFNTNGELKACKCGHPKEAHRDERGCHSNGCLCMSYE